MPTDGTRLPYYEVGEFGTSPRSDSSRASKTLDRAWILHCRERRVSSVGCRRWTGNGLSGQLNSWTAAPSNGYAPRKWQWVPASLNRFISAGEECVLETAKPRQAFRATDQSIRRNERLRNADADLAIVADRAEMERQEGVFPTFCGRVLLAAEAAFTRRGTRRGAAGRSGQRHPPRSQRLSIC